MDDRMKDTVLNRPESIGVVEFLIGVKTYMRPLMLKDLLHSIGCLELPGTASLAVADNDAKESARKTVQDFARQSPIKVQYIVVPERGLCNAFNRLIETAVADGARYLACLDDDQTVGKTWLAEIHSALEEYGADVCGAKTVNDVSRHGKIPWGDPNTPKFGWRTKVRNAVSKTSERRAVETTSICGNNFLLSERIYKDMNLRFDPKYNLSGGEETDFFARARNNGAKLIRYYGTETGVVHHVIPESRTTLRYYAKIRYRSAYSRLYFARRKKKRAAYALKFLTHVPKIILYLPPAVFSRYYFAKLVKSLMEFLAYVSYAFGRRRLPFYHDERHGH